MIIYIHALSIDGAIDQTLMAIIVDSSNIDLDDTMRYSITAG